MHHRRWASAGAASISSTGQHNLSHIEPHTYGTSWNSVRWNKPLESSSNGAGGGGIRNEHPSRFLSIVQPTSNDYGFNPSYSRSTARRFGSQPATRNNIEMK
ncbi:unnamed protein product [Gongylonema pulchrum]|uniref:Uncharacterized protein n=1 Tax=Gongylonema pulchrum TaxID=637853 RepID=A0A183ETU0_9BILA|nr:unnamed protein product [Gongylonema pulchrum]